MTDADPCANCRELISRDGIQPYCQRATQYGQVGCLRGARRTASPSGHRAPPTTGRLEVGAPKRNGGRRRG